MPGIRKFVFAACVLTSGSCFGDLGVEPVLTTTDRPELPVITTFRLSPELVSIEEGGEIRLTPVVLNQFGRPMIPFPVITYSTSSSTIASVSADGLVTGLAPGTAVISARTSVGQVTLSATRSVDVRQLVVLDSVDLSAQATGWEPTPAHIVSGGRVKWHSGVIAVSGAPTRMVYLMDSNNVFFDSLDLSGGSATRRFTSTGTIYYCSNACWDPPERGVIHVH